MACAVMFYHYSYWTFGEFNASTILGRLGLYGVSFFYILSGLTLYTVYKDYPISIRSVVLFGVKRFFRIYPLLWIVTLLYVLALRITDKELLFLNFSGLFGFIQPEASIGVGVWSIGNELFFYAFFPILIFLKTRFSVLFYGSLFLIFFAGVYFGFVLMDSNVSLATQWNLYVNPLNQFYLFAGGMLIGFVVEKKTISINRNFANFLILAAILVFALYPAEGDVITIVTKWPRVIFSIICLSLCFLIYVSEIKMNIYFHQVFSFLGATSYSVYLLHPIVYRVLKGINEAFLGMELFWLLPFSIFGTLVASFLSYQYLEKPMIHVGSKITHRIRNQRALS